LKQYKIQKPRSHPTFLILSYLLSLYSLSSYPIFSLNTFSLSSSHPFLTFGSFGAELNGLRGEIDEKRHVPRGELRDGSFRLLGELEGNGAAPFARASRSAVPLLGFQLIRWEKKKKKKKKTAKLGIHDIIR
jgi:hypothetical protein